MIKRIKLVIFIFALSSCSSLPSVNYFGAVKESAKYITGKNNFEITNETFLQQEYSFIKVRFGRSTPIIMVLAYTNQGIFEWVDADRRKIYTYNGKIIELDGFNHDIKIQHPHSKISYLHTSTKINYAVDFYSPSLLSLNINSQISINQSKKFPLIRLDKEEKFARVEEIINAPLINWTKKNIYYFNNDNQIFMTQQYVHPRMPKITIEFYFKY
tara:strand:- start:620 stop:1261 length:642 start_codon:yes stop_codon:yes gene_type:complete